MERLIKTCLLFCSVLFLFGKVHSQSFNPNYTFIHSKNKFQDKAFYFLTLIQKIPKVNTALKNNKELQNLSNEKYEQLKKLGDNCKDNLACYASALFWTKGENDIVKNALSQLYKTNGAFQMLVKNHLRQCGYFEFYEDEPGEKLLQDVWQDVADGINIILARYLLDKGMRYPQIDSASYPVSGNYYKTMVEELLYQMITFQANKLQLFFEPSLQVSMELLEVNNRDEAIRFEPLQITNSKAVAKVHSVNWKKYKYSAILVLGEGPDLPNVSLSPYGKLRCKTAAQEYKAGKAPFIIVSGGFVHPFQTPYCEAVGMKKYLISHYNIPDSVIFIDPHARHTTTNIRNANRIIFRSRIPATMKVLCVTSRLHIDYIFNGKFAKRCMEEIKHVPYNQLTFINPFEMEYYPVKNSLQICDLDPLDP
jgi:uncharacterized SAM-binding protein YcdF (DUF218 family)